MGLDQHDGRPGDLEDGECGEQFRGVPRAFRGLITAACKKPAPNDNSASAAVPCCRESRATLSSVPGSGEVLTVVTRRPYGVRLEAVKGLKA